MKSQKAEGYKYPALLFFFIYHSVSLSTRHSLSVSLKLLSHRASSPVRWSPESDGGATAPEPQTILKSNLFSSNLVIFSCLFRIRNPKFKKAYQIDRIGGKRQRRNLTPFSPLFRYILAVSFFFFFSFLFFVLFFRIFFGVCVGVCGCITADDDDDFVMLLLRFCLVWDDNFVMFWFYGFVMLLRL
jgi:hypothetical protein